MYAVLVYESKLDENVIPWGIPNLDIKWCYKHTHYSHSVCICTVYTHVYVCMLCMYVYTYVCMYVCISDEQLINLIDNCDY